MEGMRQGVTTNDALGIIDGIEAEIMVTGGVDEERRVLKNIRQKMLSNEISPSQAVRMARELAESRQNYH